MGRQHSLSRTLGVAVFFACGAESRWHSEILKAVEQSMQQYSRDSFWDWGGAKSKYTRSIPDTFDLFPLNFESEYGRGKTAPSRNDSTIMLIWWCREVATEQRNIRRTRSLWSSQCRIESIYRPTLLSWSVWSCRILFFHSFSYPYSFLKTKFWFLGLVAR